jgi:hypothetical protein
MINIKGVPAWESRTGARLVSPATGCEKKKEGSMNNANHIQAAAAMEIEIPEESGWSKRKRVPHKLADTLNGCLCGQVLDSSLNGVLECKQAGCETQWVSTVYYER